MANSPERQASKVIIRPYKPVLSLIWPGSILLAIILRNTCTPNSTLTGLILALGVINIIVYVYMLKSAPTAERGTRHLFLLFLVFAALTTAGMLGDFVGSVHFGPSASDGIGLMTQALAAGIFVIPIAAFLYTIVCFKYAFAAHTTRSLSVITKVIVWLLTAVGAYILYGISYSLRDPSTE